MPRVPLVTGAVERTEVDMKLGDMLFEAKLTEGDFQIQDAAIVQRYCDLKEVFECRKLPRQGKHYVSYQLLRNVLAAHALIFVFASCSMPVGRICWNTGIASCNVCDSQLSAPDARYSRGRNWCIVSHRHYASSCT